MDFGRRLSELRKEKGISQEKLAEMVGVSRQAVTKWESGKSLPNEENLFVLSEIFDIPQEELFPKEKKSAPAPEAKINCLLAAAPPVIAILYFVYCIAAGSFDAGAIICLFVICFPMTLTVNLTFGMAVKTGDFSMIAGFEPNIEYNIPEVKKYIAVLLHLLNITTASTAAMMALAFVFLGSEEIVVFLLFGYILSYITVILFMGYKNSDRIFKNPKDAEKSKRGFPSAAVLIGMIFLSAAAMVLALSAKEIENNSTEALSRTGLMLLSIGFSLAGFLLEGDRIRKTEEAKPLFGKTFLILNGAAFAVILIMAII